MKIQETQPLSPAQPVKAANEKPKEHAKEKNKSNIPEAVKYEPTPTQEPATYKKTGHVYDKSTIDRLKKESEDAYAQLRSLVEKLLLKQGYQLETITNEEWQQVEIDEATRQEAQAMIAPDGPFSAEAVSSRIVEFAKAISGGDLAKLDQLKSAIEEGFKQAKAVLGELPEISKETHRFIMEKLDKWSQETQTPSEVK